MTRTCCLRRRGQLRRRGLELVQRLDRLRAAAILDVVDEAHERVDDRRRNALLTRKRADSADLRVDITAQRWPGGGRVREELKRDYETLVARFGCSRKKRSISRLASGPRGSVYDPSGLPPDHA
jgi:hypothetical protein